MSKLVVFGATGRQGCAILTTLLAHPELSKKYSLRGITRNASKPQAKELAAQGVEIVEADIDQPKSLPRALEQANTVVLITETQYEADLKEREFRQAKTVADAAVAAGVEFFLFSTAVHCSKLWDAGPVDGFDSKAEIEAYLRTLPFRTGYFAPGMFMQNIVTVMAPRRQDDGTYIIVGVNDPATKIPLIESAKDAGHFVVPLLKDPIGMDGRVVYAGTASYSFDEVAAIISNASGETVRYVQVPREVYAGFMKPEQGGRMVAMMTFFDNPGYFGPGTEELLQESLKLVDGKLTTFEEFAEKYLAQL